MLFFLVLSALANDPVVALQDVTTPMPYRGSMSQAFTLVVVTVGGLTFGAGLYHLAKRNRRNA